ncbi:MAG: hypothetical protein L3J76_01145, partial [Candidatus Hydrothermae bacterium]|nr:hypothetical protein [Candidatus Hydrothermae bacterium]
REERDRLLRFLDHPRPGEPIEIVNTRGDTVYLRIVARPGEAKQSGPGSTLSRNQNTMRKGVGHSENHERSFR